ncbi:MAG: class I SAM-dependent methyltransferase [Syntrophobacterales bacterium]|nr:class I SAM-dependent methyltransferase [Syntrophobacterales bacterium]
MISNKKQKIRTRSSHNCYICGAKGQPLYHGLEDRLFGAPGLWDLKKCPDPECGLVWMDPMPIEEDIGKAYETYYTHEEETNGRNDNLKKTICRQFLRKLYVLFRFFAGLDRQWQRVYMMYLDHIQPGKLLEIGCGNGQRLALFQSRGWIVEGQEVDQKAARQVYNRFGIKVYLGKLEHLDLKETTYDAIIINHVIEHVHDPVDLLKECRCLLKPKGLLIAITPNIESRGHRIFRSCWYGLDPPRHLRLYSVNTLRKLAEQAGFTKINSWTTAANADVIARGSFKIRRTNKHNTLKWSDLILAVKTLWFHLFSSLSLLLNKYSGEECVLRVVK